MEKFSLRKALRFHFPALVFLKIVIVFIHDFFNREETFIESNDRDFSSTRVLDFSNFHISASIVLFTFLHPLKIHVFPGNWGFRPGLKSVNRAWANVRKKVWKFKNRDLAKTRPIKKRSIRFPLTKRSPTIAYSVFEADISRDASFVPRDSLTSRETNLLTRLRCAPLALFPAASSPPSPQ